MQVTYTAPNRSHHYRYAAALARAGCLHRFVSGFSRFSPRAKLPEAKGKLLRADEVQNLYLASLKLRLPTAVSDELAYLSKIWLDRCSEKPARASDLFLFYSGAGLRTAQRLQSTGALRVVEAVNSHVEVQHQMMEEEHRRLGLPVPRFHTCEVARRVEEYQIADAILCPSHFVKKSFAEKGIPAARILVVPYGIDIHAPTAFAKTQRETFRVLYVGQISVRKGLRYLFEAFRALRYPKKELIIVGPTTHQTGLENAKPPENTHFLGVLKGDALEQVYQHASVFVLPSIEEGLALVLGEALSFGTPVIATENSGASDLFTDRQEGFIIPIRSPEAITEKLQWLADDPDLRAWMSNAARRRAQTLDGWEGTGCKLVESLKSVTRAALP
jgi:glycosyltransferase involved in cell wall biosynthesis